MDGDFFCIITEYCEVSLARYRLGCNHACKTVKPSASRLYSANTRADAGGKFQLLAWVFHTAATN